MKPFLPEFLSLSLAVVFVDNGYNEAAIKIPSVLPAQPAGAVPGRPASQAEG